MNAQNQSPTNFVFGINDTGYDDSDLRQMNLYSPLGRDDEVKGVQERISQGAIIALSHDTLQPKVVPVWQLDVNPALLTELMQLIRQSNTYNDLEVYRFFEGGSAVLSGLSPREVFLGKRNKYSSENPKFQLDVFQEECPALYNEQQTLLDADITVRVKKIKEAIQEFHNQD